MIDKPAEWSVIRHEGADLYLDVPRSWTLRQNFLGSPVALLHPDSDDESFRPNLNVTLQKRTSDETLEGLLKVQLEQLERFLTDFKLHEREDVTVHDVKAARIRATYRQGRFDVAVFQWVLDTTPYAAAITASCQLDQVAELSATFEKIATSLRFGSGAADPN